MSDFYSKYLDLINKEKSNYRGAGIFFFEKYDENDFMLLLGIDNKYNGNNFSVFGGGRDKEDPDSLHTAVREVFEELFNVRPGNIDSVVQEMKSKIADLKNIGGPNGGMISAGKFLETFVSAPYVHMDVAGPTWLDAKENYKGISGTGYGVRLLYTFLKNY